MSMQNKLMNPTPWEVKLNYEKGVVIKVPAFGDHELTMQQMDDYRDGKPGSENVQEVLNYHGLFLLNGDRPYNNQALAALKACLRQKKERFRGIEKSLQDQATNLPGGGAPIEEKIVTFGYAGLRDQIEVLEKQIKFLSQSVTEEPGLQAQAFDPERTIYLMTPPKEFPSKEAMEFFLDLPENAELKMKHQEFIDAQKQGAENAAE